MTDEIRTGAPPSLEGEPAKMLFALLSGERRQSGRTLLITGPWGCGKTYLWKESVVPALKRPHIYVSAFGVDGASALKGRLLAHFGLNLLGRTPVGEKVSSRIKGWAEAGKKFLGRGGSAIGSLVNSIGNTLLQRADIDPIELADVLDQDTIICIDDVERVSTHFNVEDLLGIANILSEHKGLDVVLICNEEQLLAGDAERARRYALYKEKAISNEFYVTADPSSMFDRIAHGAVRSEAANKRVSSAEPVIKEVFERSGTKNLRLLARVCRHLETMQNAGIRELTESEVRFLTAATIFTAIDNSHDDNFFVFSPIVLGMKFSSSGRQKPVDPDDIARKEFIDKYFGDREYEDHPGVLQVIRKGMVDPKSFLTPEMEDPPEYVKSIRAAANGKWAYFNDAEVRQFRKTLSDHLLASEVASPADILSCLAYVRLLDSILFESTADLVAPAATVKLQEMAKAGEGGLPAHWKMQFSELIQFVSHEHDTFAASFDEARHAQIAKTLKDMIEMGGLKDMARVISGANLEPLRAIFENIGLDIILGSRKTDPLGFKLTVSVLLRQCLAFEAIWPEASQHRKELERRLEGVRDDPNEERMTRWRVKNILIQEKQGQ